MFSEGLEKVKMLPEPWNNVGQVWVEKAMYDFPMRVYLGPFMEEYSRLEGTEERAKFLDDVYNGCEAKGIQSFCKLFPDADPDHARRKTMDSDARAKYISVSTVLNSWYNLAYTQQLVHRYGDNGSVRGFPA